MADPNGFFRGGFGGGGGGPIVGQQPVVVKIRNLSSRPELNNRFGIVEAYQADRGRYLVRLVPNSSSSSTSTTASSALNFLSLTPHHVLLANWREQLQVTYLLVRYDPHLHRKFQTIYQQVAQRVAPIPLSVLVSVVTFVWLASCYFLGFFRTIFWSSIFGLILMGVGPYLLRYYNNNNNNNNNIIRRIGTWLTNDLPNQVQMNLERFIPILRGHLNRPRTVGIITTVILLLVIMATRQLLVSNQHPGRPLPLRPSNLPWPTTTTTTKATARRNYDNDDDATKTTLMSPNDYYKLGFEDATEGKSYGISMPSPNKMTLLEQGSGSSRSDEAVSLEEAMDDLPPPPPQTISTSSPHHSHRGRPSTSNSSSANLVGTIMSAWYIGKTIWDLGRDPMTSVWNWDRARQGLSTLPLWQMAILGVTGYRIVMTISEMIMV